MSKNTLKKNTKSSEYKKYSTWTHAYYLPSRKDDQKLEYVSKKKVKKYLQNSPIL